MRALFETLFDIVYLVTVITLGIRMIRGSKGNRQFQLFGWMAVVLGAGDSFHLVPRALALCTTGFDAYAVQLGLGKWITSITTTIFYVLLYYVWRERYQVKNHVGTTVAIFALAVMRVAAVHAAAKPVAHQPDPACMGYPAQHPVCHHGPYGHRAVLPQCQGR